MPAPVGPSAISARPGSPAPAAPRPVALGGALFAEALQLSDEGLAVHPVVHLGEILGRPALGPADGRDPRRVLANDLLELGAAASRRTRSRSAQVARRARTDAPA